MTTELRTTAVAAQVASIVEPPLAYSLVGAQTAMSSALPMLHYSLCSLQVAWDRTSEVTITEKIGSGTSVTESGVSGSLTRLVLGTGTSNTQSTVTASTGVLEKNASGTSTTHSVASGTAIVVRMASGSSDEQSRTHGNLTRRRRGNSGNGNGNGNG